MFHNQTKDMINHIARLLLLLLVVCSFSCNKENQKAPGNKVNILVTEFKTNIPIQGATVFIVDIGLNIFSGSAVRSTTQILQTDSNGVCPIPESYFNDATYGILVSKDGYWQTDLDLFATSKPTSYELQRKSQLRVHLIQLNSYTDIPIFQMGINGELPGYTVTPFTSIRLPADSTFSLDVYGGQTNQVKWEIMGQSGDSLAGGTIPVDVLPTGITDVEIKY